MKAQFKVTGINYNQENQNYEVSIETTNFAENQQDCVIVDYDLTANPAQLSELFPLARMSESEIREALELAEEAVKKADPSSLDNYAIYTEEEILEIMRRGRLGYE